MKPLSILVADDVDAIRGLMVRWLVELGHDVTEVTSGRDALRRARDTRYDLVITDILMPDGDGFDVISGLRRQQPEARIVAISGGGRHVQGADCVKIAKGLGAHATVMKPFSRQQLFQGIRTAYPEPASEAT